MPFNTQGFGNMFGGSNQDTPTTSDLSYIRSTPVPYKVGGIEAGTMLNTDVFGVLDAILFPYQNPTVTLTSTATTTIRQRGVDKIEGMTLTATCTKKTSPLYKVEFYMGSTLLDTQEYLDTNVFTYEYSGTITETTIFSCKVYDNKSKTGTSSLTFNFYYPNFSCVSVSEITDITMNEIVTNGTMRLEIKSATKTLTYSGTMARYIYCFPSEWGNLSSILDTSGFEYINAFQKISLTYTSGTDATPMTMYVSKDACSLTNFKYTFKF